MTNQTITIELPEAVLRKLAKIADATHQPIEALVAQSILSNLPPSSENAPPEIQAELLSMQILDNSALKAIAGATIDPQQVDRLRRKRSYQHNELLRKNEEEQITLAERQELLSLRNAADHLMLRKAYAWSVLRWRGQRIPALSELPL